MPDPEKILATVRRATGLFRATPGRSGGVVTLAPESVDEVLVVGDLHGNIPAFRRVLEVAALAAHPKRHLVLQELAHGPWMYPGEGGDRSHQLIDVVCALKCQHPDRVHLILGNHELSELTNRPIAKNGIPLNALFRRGVETAYGPRGPEVHAAYLELFAALPLAVRTPNRVFLCHTIPDAIDLDRTDLGVLALDVWPDEAMKRHGTVYNLTWGRDTAPETADRFAEMVDADWFITGHQPCDDGFQQANHRQIIIDGTDPYPAYCLFPANEPVTIASLLAGVRTFDRTG
ncbi:MAG: metallophosphoesterase [Isosphaeraceae bacterium]